MPSTGLFLAWQVNNALVRRADSMADKRMTGAEVVGRLHSGMTIGIGGWAARRKPMSLVREILRSDLEDLTVVSYGGPDVGPLCAAATKES